MTVDVSAFNQELIILERLYYEISGRENIINFLIKQNQKETDYFNNLWEDYLSYLKAYQEMKFYFQINCINKIINRTDNYEWSLSFILKEVYINDK